MRKIITLLLVVAGLEAQVDWFGYYEAEADYLKLPDNQLYFGYHKFRLDLDSAPSDRIRVSANLVYKYYDGTTTFNFMEFIDQSYWPELPTEPMSSSMIILDELPYQLTDTLFLDNAFFELHHNSFDLTLGRQQIPSGVGYAWNPTDLFNNKDLMDPTYEDTGVPATRIAVPIGLSTTVTGIIQPGDSWNNSTQYYQVKTGLGRFDVSLLYGKTDYTETGLLTAGNWERELVGLNLEGELFGLGTRAEMAVNRLDYDTDDLKYEYIIGGDYTLENSLYLLGEFYHNDFGVSVDNTRFDDYLIALSGQRKSVNQNYFFLMAMYPLGDLLLGTIFGITNLDDGSWAVNPQLVYNIFEDVELSLTTSFFIGDNRDEFGYQSAGLRLRLKAYF
ncbi:MAG: hypothetical protein ABIA75_07170 [Candidatus Neomarinimicrobiota bacterium]